MGRKLLFILLFGFLSAQAQDLEPSTLFSDAIGRNIKSYKAKSQRAYADKNFDLAEKLYDSLIKFVVNGSTLDNFQVRKLSGRKIKLHDFEKPVFLMTYASWCTPGVGEIPALNEIASKYHKDIDFVILFWDTKKRVKKIAGEYNSKINVVYVDELENNHCHTVQTMKHSLGFPTSFFIDADKKILDVRRGALHHYNEAYEVSYELNYSSFLNGISLLKTLPRNAEGLVIDHP